MNKLEWEVLRNLDRRTRFVASEVHKIKLQGEKIDSLEIRLQNEVLPTVNSMKKILERRKRVRKYIFWVLSLIIAAAVTTYVNNSVTMYMSPDTRASHSNREVDSNELVE